MSLVVKFKNGFHIPGFGRKRFPVGIVTDVPDALKDLLPKSAEILEGYVEEEVLAKEAEDLRAADYARAATDTSAKILHEAGLSGLEDALAEKDKTIKEINKAADEAEAAEDAANKRIKVLEAQLATKPDKPKTKTKAKK